MKSPAVELQELPTPGCGVRIVPVEELVAKCAIDTALREAIDIMERAAGAPSEVKIGISKQLRHDMFSTMRAESQRRAIEYGMRKHKVIGAHESRVS